MDIDQQALNYMNQRRILHIDMLEALRHQRADVIKTASAGVLLRHRHRNLLLLSAGDKRTAAELMADIKEINQIVVRQSFCQDLMHEKFGLDQSVPCIQHAYLEPDLLPVPELDAIISPLTLKDVPFIMKHYSLQLDQDYIEDRVRTNSIYGLFTKRQLIGFAGFHAEGSLGMLEIIPDFRRQGLACYLQSHLTNGAVSQNRIPYTQIKVGNEASLALQKKCHYQFDSQPISWMFKG